MDRTKGIKIDLLITANLGLPPIGGAIVGAIPGFVFNSSNTHSTHTLIKISDQDDITVPPKIAILGERIIYPTNYKIPFTSKFKIGGKIAICYEDERLSACSFPSVVNSFKISKVIKEFFDKYENRDHPDRGNYSVNKDEKYVIFTAQGEFQADGYDIIGGAPEFYSSDVYPLKEYPKERLQKLFHQKQTFYSNNGIFNMKK